MKNDFYINKVQPKVKKKNVEKKNRVLAILLLCLFAFWSICSILGLIAYFRDDDIKTASADTLTYSVFYDSLRPDDSMNFLYKDYNFIGQPNGNFSSPFRIKVLTSSAVSMTLYLRFDIADYNAPNGFGLFFNGDYQYTPAFTRILLDNITYYKVVLSTNTMQSILNYSSGEFSLMSLNYDYDNFICYDFDLFIVRGTSSIYSPNYFEGYLSTDSYSKGYAEGQKSSNYSEFFNGSGTFTYGLGSNYYTESFVPNDLSQYFSNGVFLFSKYVLETLNYNLFNFSGGSLQFTFSRELEVSPNNFLITTASGLFNSGQNLGLTMKYYRYNVDTGLSVYAGSNPVIEILDYGVVSVNDQFYSINNTITEVNGSIVNNYGPVSVDTIVIDIDPVYFRDDFLSENITINLGFPTGFYNGYQAGVIDGQNSIDIKHFYDQGYNAGKEYANAEYQRGYTEGSENANNNSWLSLFGAVVDAPIQALTGLFNFEMLGFNMMSLFMGLITLAVTIFVIRLFI